jgi:hypothetical protein
MKQLKRAALLTGAILLAGRAYALTDTIDLPDIGTFPGLEDYNLTDAFSGNGFVGIYPSPPAPNAPGPAFGHVFGLEHYVSIYSETELQADIGALAGDAITSAYLDFTIVDGGGDPESVDVTEFVDSSGNLGFNAKPPSDLGEVIGTGIFEGPNSIDVTSLVQNAVGSGKDYLGLYLTPQGPSSASGLWTYTYAGDGANADSAAVSLVINYTSVKAAVPDSGSTLALIAIGIGGIAAFGLRRAVNP